MLSYSVPMMACYFLLGPTYNIVPTLYAKYYGLDLTTVAAVVLATRVFDAIADPLIGYLSDRHRMRGGTRKAWVLGGGLAIIVAAHFLFAPPAHPSALYYLTWNFGFFIAYSLMEIPHITWGGELTKQYAQRSTIYSYRSAAIFAGFILWAAFPLLPMFRTAEFTPEVLRAISYAGAALVAATVVWAAFQAPSGTSQVLRSRDSWRQIAGSIFFNKPLLILLAAYFFCVLGLGMWQGLVFLYLDSHMRIGSRFALMQLVSNVVGFISIPVWKGLAQTFDKSTIWMIGIGPFVVFNAGFLMIEPGATWWQALALMALIHACFSCVYMIVPSILSDVVDYAELKFRQNRGATYFALNTLLSKIGVGAGGALGLAIAGYYGVQASEKIQTGRAILGLRLAYIIVPIALVIVSSLFIAFTPIDRRRHMIVRRRIESRNGRLPRAAPA